MKSFGGPITKIVLTSGPILPRAPVPGEMFHLDIDMPIVDPLLPWHSKGSYVFNGQQWMMLNDTGKRRIAAAISATSLEVEIASLANQLPNQRTGFQLAELTITPTNRKATFSGQATVWVNHSMSAHVWLVVFRKDKIASIVVQHVPAGMPQTMGLTFYDIPNSHEDQVYTLRAYTDTIGMLGINQCTKFSFDGVPETAFIVEQNS